MYAMPFLYRLSTTTNNNHLSIIRLYHAFQNVIKRHSALRTALYHDKNGNIIQHCFDTISNDLENHTPQFSTVNLPKDHCHVNEIINKILGRSDLFDLSKGQTII